jgi:Ribonuclease G/E
MAKPKNKLTPPNSFELLGFRIQKIISAPAAQKRKMAVICREANECLKDWKRLLEEIAETEHVLVHREDDCTARISWDLPANI